MLLIMIYLFIPIFFKELGEYLRISQEMLRAIKERFGFHFLIITNYCYAHRDMLAMISQSKPLFCFNLLRVTIYTVPFCCIVYHNCFLEADIIACMITDYSLFPVVWVVTDL